MWQAATPHCLLTAGALPPANNLCVGGLQGNKLTRARTNTGSVDVAKNTKGQSIAVASYRGSSSSAQTGGRPAVATSSGQVSAGNVLHVHVGTGQ